MCGTSVSSITYNTLPMPAWSVYLVDVSTGIIVQRYPGIYNDREVVEQAAKEAKKFVPEARYALIVLPYDAYWTTTRG